MVLFKITQYILVENSICIDKLEKILKEVKPLSL